MRTRPANAALFAMMVLILMGCGADATNKPPNEELPTSAALTTAISRIGTTVQAAGGSYIDLSALELSNLLRNKSFPLINVHIPYEGELPQTDTFIPYNEITQRLDALPADKNAPVVLYCRSGRMSTEASQALVRLGYTNVMNLAGGWNAWQAAGYDLLQKR